LLPPSTNGASGAVLTRPVLPSAPPSPDLGTALEGPAETAKAGWVRTGRTRLWFGVSQTPGLGAPAAHFSAPCRGLQNKAARFRRRDVKQASNRRGGPAPPGAWMDWRETAVGDSTGISRYLRWKGGGVGGRRPPEARPEGAAGPIPHVRRTGPRRVREPVPGGIQSAGATG
jgi:hypothetical protein